MRRRTLGRTELEVSELSLGGLYLSSRGTGFEQAKQAITRAVEIGINYMDTAPAYMNSEAVIGEVLDTLDQKVIVSTKLGGFPDPFDPKSKDCLIRSIETSLKNFKRDYIDILMVHEPDRPGEFDWWDRCGPDLTGPVIELLEQLKKDGVIRYTGVGGTTAYEMANIVRFGNFDILLTAFQYSLLWREATIDLIPAAREKNMGIIIGSPLQHGALAARYDEELERGVQWLNSPRRKQMRRLYAYLDSIGLDIVEASLRFLISDSDVSTVLVGARSQEEVMKNAAIIAKGTLGQNVIKELDDIAAMVPFRPYEEPYNMPFGHGYKGPGKIH